ncbi:NAD-dependent epimerase/dehydratase family protein [Alphaproteobacteria bacterium]|nr:NAD-dependent epimerase/dehydratase family protein [Alphaproteobacteria bacterium]
MYTLITGCAGFIGYHTVIKLTKKKIKVIGIDNLNSYYDVNLKKKRLNNLKKQKLFKFYKVDIENYKNLKKIFIKYEIKYVIHLAAQAGVRYSITNPDKYFNSNIKGHYNLINVSKNFKVKHFMYASSSSVYGNNNNFPIVEDEPTDFPQSFYAASKKINEIMTYSYSSVYKLPSTALRFFTVYGPYGRPDMFLFKLVKSIKDNKKINIHNFGKHERDFTYIDDVTNSISKLLLKPPKHKSPHEIYNIGSDNPVKLRAFISITEKILNKKAKENNIKLQLGDVVKTHANNKKLLKKTGVVINTKIDIGIKKFIDWYFEFTNTK